MIGAFGSMIFEITDKHVFVPTDESLTAGCKIEVKESSGKPQTTGSTPELRAWKCKLRLKRELGINVQVMQDHWLKMAEDGATGYINMGGQPLAANPFRLHSCSVSDISRDGVGELASVTLACDFQEYVGAPAKKKKAKKKKKKSGGGGGDEPTTPPSNPYDYWNKNH